MYLMLQSILIQYNILYQVSKSLTIGMVQLFEPCRLEK
jgi:hypothetical protein